MKKSVLILVLLVFALGVLLIVRTSSKVQESIRYPAQDRLQWYAKKAKAEGKNRVTVPGQIIDYAGVDLTLDEAIRDYSVVAGEPVGNRSYIVNSEDVITWYKFRTLDTLSRRDYRYCHTCAPIPEIPGEMASLSHDEFLLPISGGTVTVDGVEITMENNSIPQFENNKAYILFVSLAPSGIAALAAGPSGIFRVKEDETLEALNRKDSPIQSQIKQRFDLNLSRLKSHLKN